MKAQEKLALALGVAAAVMSRPVRAQHDMTHTTSGVPLVMPLGIPFSRLGSATSWLPDSSPMRAHHVSLGNWMLMLHGAAYGQYNHQNGLRGATQVGVIDWEMLMAARSLAGGVLRVSSMTSLESLVLGPSGYPEIVQTGGTYQGARLVNRQHPHDLITELGAAYDRSITRNLAASIYIAAVGEPALGPVTYMHRPSAAADPFAPIGHHWQDASHGSFGVVTVGLYSRAVKLEGSVFNAREADAYHLNLDYAGGRLDSYAGRLTVTPNAHVAVAAWGGYLMAHDRLESSIGMQRYGVSFSTSGRPRNHAWSSTAIWGLNIHHHGARSHVHDPNATNVKFYHVSSSVLLESTIALTRKTEVTARLEQVQKSGDELGFLGGDLTQLFTIRGFSLAVAHDVLTLGGFSLAVGGRASVNRLPQTLKLTYQTRMPTGFALYARIR